MKKIIFISLFIALFFSACSVKTNAEVYKNSPKEAVVLIHGFGRSEISMWYFEDQLENAGYAVKTIGYSSLTQDMNGIKQEAFYEINSQELSQYKRVHFIGHSLGGLLARSYLGENRLENLGNVVIMGSPNKGTAVVDRYSQKWWFSLLGPAVKELGTGGTKFLKSLKKPYYNLGVIAGNGEKKEHEHILKGVDDGLVTVSSAKVQGMKDFILLNSNHTMMRYNKDVIQQALYFIKNASFFKEKNKV